MKTRGSLHVVVAGIRGETVLEIDKLIIYRSGGRATDSRKNIYMASFEWPRLVDFRKILYFLGITDFRGRSFDVFRVVDQRGMRIKLEVGNV